MNARWLRKMRKRKEADVVFVVRLRRVTNDQGEVGWHREFTAYNYADEDLDSAKMSAAGLLALDGGVEGKIVEQLGKVGLRAVDLFLGKKETDGRSD